MGGNITVLTRFPQMEYGLRLELWQPYFKSAPALFAKKPDYEHDSRFCIEKLQWLIKSQVGVIMLCSWLELYPIFCFLPSTVPASVSSFWLSIFSKLVTQFKEGIGYRLTVLTFVTEAVTVTGRFLSCSICVDLYFIYYRTGLYDDKWSVRLSVDGVDTPESGICNGSPDGWHCSVRVS